MTTPENPARWAPDPLGRHQYRYWDGAQWTEHVSDDGSDRSPIDPPRPRRPPRSTAGGAGATHPVTVGTRHARHAPTAGARGVLRRRRPPGATRPRCSVGATARSSSTPPSASSCSAPVLPVRDERTPAEMLRVPGVPPLRDRLVDGRVRQPRRHPVDDTVYEANGGAVPPRVRRSRSSTSRCRRVCRRLAREADDGLRVVTAGRRASGSRAGVVRWAVFAVDGPLTPLPLRHHHVVGVGGPSAPRRHGRGHLRRRQRRRPPPGSVRRRGLSRDLNRRGGATRRSGARRSTCSVGKIGVSSGVNHCRLGDLLLVEGDLAREVARRRSRS